MAIQLKDYYRGVPPKNKRYHNSLVQQDYKRRFNYCENCAIFGDHKQSSIELHHIIPGSRDDYTWNIINLCTPCHEKATYHKEGAKARFSNAWLFAIKHLKGEIGMKKLFDLGFEEETRHALYILEPDFIKWKKGLK